MAPKSFGENGKNKAAATQPSGEGKDNADFVGYVNVNLTDEQKALYAQWSQSASLWEAFAFQVGSGVNVSVKRSIKESCFIASGTQRSEFSPNAGLCVTARGGTAEIAFGRLLYILTYLSASERWTDLQPVANPDRW